MNQGIIFGKILNSDGTDASGKAVALNHIGRITDPIRTTQGTAFVVANSNGVFRLDFGWEPTDLGRVVDAYVGDTLQVPYQLNVFNETTTSMSLVTRVVGEFGRSDSTHIYNRGALLTTCESLGNIASGVGPPPPYDRMMDVVNAWGEFRRIPLPAAIQQGGFMRPSPEFYALISFIVIRL